MTSELAYEASDEASENELLDRSLSVWRGWSAIEWEDFTPIALDIHTACSIGQYDWVRSLIARNDGLALDRKNHGGWTPLMYACYIGHDNVVNLLINAGCQLSLKNPRGHTPLMLAASCGNETVARTLIRNGAELELSDKCGWTALFHATYAGHQNFVAYLLETGANMDAVEPVTGMTPFMEAAAEGHEIIVQIFLRKGVNVNAKAYNGDMARSLALINGYMKIVSLIDNHVMPLSSLRSEPGLDFYLSSSDDGHPKLQTASTRQGRGKSKGPSIRDGPEAIARMIDRTRNTDITHYSTPALPKGYMTFSGAGEVKGGGTQLSHRDVTSPINPDDYKDNSGTDDFDDDNDESNAFTKTGAITIKSSSSSSGGLIAALGLSREGSIDSDDSRSVELTNSSSDTNLRNGKGNEENSITDVRDASDSGQSKSASCTENDRLEADSMSKKSGNFPLLTVSSEDRKEKDKPWAVVSPLRDYFPLEVPFQVSFADAPTQNHTEMGMAVSSSSHLPVENMSQAEIVSRYLNNLSLGGAPAKTVESPVQSTPPSQQHGSHNLYPEGGNSNAAPILQDFPPQRSQFSSGNENLVSTSYILGNEHPSQNAFGLEMAGRNMTMTGINETHSLGSLVTNSERSRIPFIGPEEIQDLSAQSSVNFMPQNIGSRTSTASRLHSQPPYVHSHQPHPPYLLPASHHHHHHHFHTSQQTQNVRNVFSSASTADYSHLRQHHYEMAGGQKHYLPNVPGFYNLQQHLVDSHPGDVHPYLQTVPPELYYRDIDSGPHLHPAPPAQTLNTNAPEPVVIQASSSFLNTMEQSKCQDIKSTFDCSLPLVTVTPQKSENSQDRLATDQYSNLFHNWPISTEVTTSNPIIDHTSNFGEGVPGHKSLTHKSPVSANTKTNAVFNPTNPEPKIFHRLDARSNPVHHSTVSERTRNKNVSSHSSNTSQHDMIHSKTASAVLALTSTAPNGQGQAMPAASDEDLISPLPQADHDRLRDAAFKNPSVLAGNASNTPASVMIPGHTTSQPISQSVAWLNQTDRVGAGPHDLQEMLAQLGLNKYLEKFEEQDVDLPVFLSLTDNDLKELGIKLFGPRKKMTNAIARWHSNAPVACSELEQAYADRLEGEMQEMAIQLNQACANEENLKAQVLQEQQLRSVTEGCLMEMRMSWSQAKQLIQDARSTMHTMGELLSRIRHNQKELRKSFVNRNREHSQSSYESKESKSGGTDITTASKRETGKITLSSMGGGKHKSLSEASKGDSKHSLRDQMDKDTNPYSSIGEAQGAKRAAKDGLDYPSPDPLDVELMKKSEKCIKDMQQALNSLNHNHENILKSTQNMNTPD